MSWLLAILLAALATTAQAGDRDVGGNGVFRVSAYKDFSAAVAAANAANGGLLIVDADSTITPDQMPVTINNHVHVTGVARGFPQLNPPATITCSFPSANGQPDECIDVNGSYVTIERLGIDTMNIADNEPAQLDQRDVIIFQDGSDNFLTLRDLYIEGSEAKDGTGIWLAGCLECRIENVMIDDLEIALYVTNATPPAGAPNNNLVVSKNRFYASVVGVVIDGRSKDRQDIPAAITVRSACTGPLRFESNVIEGGVTGIYLASDADGHGGGRTQYKCDIYLENNWFENTNGPVTCMGAQTGTPTIYQNCCTGLATGWCDTNIFAAHRGAIHSRGNWYSNDGIDIVRPSGSGLSTVFDSSENDALFSPTQFNYAASNSRLRITNPHRFTATVAGNLVGGNRFFSATDCTAIHSGNGLYAFDGDTCFEADANKMYVVDTQDGSLANTAADWVLLP